jgi:protein required for attachment to host cells
MPKQRTIWFVLADGSRARIVTRRAEGRGYEIAAEYDSAEARQPSRDILSDRPGHTQESGYSGRHAIEPKSDVHRERKADFARDVAERLNAAGAGNAFDALVLYAAPRTLAELRDALDEPTKRKVKAEFAKDLTKVPLEKLSAHFAEVL